MYLRIFDCHIVVIYYEDGGEDEDEDDIDVDFFIFFYLLLLLMRDSRN